MQGSPAAGKAISRIMVRPPSSTMLKFVDDVALPDVVRANVDISHLHLMGVQPQEIRRLKGRIAHVHLSDCDGKVHGDMPPGRGEGS